VRARSGHVVKVHPAPGVSDGVPLVNIAHVSYLQFQDIIIEGPFDNTAGQICVFVNAGTSYIIFKQVEIRNCRSKHFNKKLPTGSQGIFIGNGGNPGGDPSNIVIDSCFIHDNGDVAPDDHGVYIGEANNVLVVNSVFTRNVAWDIQIYPQPQNVHVIHCTLDKSYSRNGAVVGKQAAHVLIANTLITNHPVGGLTDYAEDGYSPRDVRVDTCNFFNNRQNTHGLDYVIENSVRKFKVRNSKHVNPHYVNSGGHYSLKTDFRVSNSALNSANSAYTVRYDASGALRASKRATIGAFQIGGGKRKGKAKAKGKAKH